jgi:hypothetical protein
MVILFAIYASILDKLIQPRREMYAMLEEILLDKV